MDAGGSPWIRTNFTESPTLRATWPRSCGGSAQDYSRLEKIRPYLPEGMKLMVMGPGGVPENVIKLVGYDNICIMVYEEPELARAVFDNVGSRLVEYYDSSVGYDTVGMVCSNDDWGFNTQTFLSPAMLERTKERGGYALGSGNSIADFIPAENYDAMLRAAMEFDG